MNYNNLKKYGLTPRFEQESTLYEGLFLARVTEQHRDLYKVVGENGEMPAAVSGKLAFNAADAADFPAVGDWVMTDKEDGSTGNAVIREILRRRSAFERKAAGTSRGSQIIAANIDLVFICMSLNADFNLRRLERYLSVAWDSGATPVVLLTKGDLCDDLGGKLAEISTVCLGTDVVVCSSMEEDGHKDVLARIESGKTIAFIGSSGVGKSSLINRLMGKDLLETKEIRSKDDRGRHTTTHRELLLLPCGGIVIDTPGMRELQLDSGNLSKSFQDIAEFAEHCRYRDCSHTSEPGCAVINAVETGALSRERLDSYKKLQTELNYEGLNSRQLEQEKIKKMFGSKGEMKQAMRYVKIKNKP
jgi:ribosome biogenesis GTPase